MWFIRGRSRGFGGTGRGMPGLWFTDTPVCTVLTIIGLLGPIT
jgi:hypothetical protein